ncbi:probable mediator of RNA polymerase II transcription subunit 26c [Gastrolobium bilobum]|uniref:probable mediator of RNA polymerase II transcription subunit 26c n=1 Tax=Gastrolobium bilobum TaxID=150636 RepID=UPI002AB140D3|nr:probable mediator of RNA polymerase II transcription subunit 26c [Gastrolobium bilobum]
MDLEKFRSILESAGVDVWVLMDAAITVASVDYANELKRRRDGIVERLYTASTTAAPSRCRNCEANNGEIKRQSSPSTDKEKDPYGGLFDDEEKKILEIKDQLEDPHQSEDSLVELLQNLADMDITFQALEDTAIGRHVNRLRKHSSNEVKRLVKLLVSKWRETVDEWVMLETPGEPATAVMVDEDSPQQKNPQNGHHQIPDFGNSPNLQNGSFWLERNHTQAELKPKAFPRKEAPPKPEASLSVPTSLAPQKRQREQRETNFDSERLASARRRLQENYKEAANAKRQRTIQVMDLHELPKPKNAFFGKTRGGGAAVLRERHR